MNLEHYVGEARVLARALRANRFKITIFVLTVNSAPDIDTMVLVDG